MLELFDRLERAWLHPSPWWAPYLPLAQEVVATARELSIVRALNAVSQQCNAPVRFVDHNELPAGEPYEAFIYRTKSVPTRHNAHDFFNAMVWLHYPKSKQRLNQLQAEQIELRGTIGPRGALRDALTVFDENGAILQASPGLLDALRNRNWRSLFVDQRPKWHGAQFVIFGHALLEKLIEPRKSITAHVWIIESQLDSYRIDDAALSKSLSAERLAGKPFAPLPVLGIPGWWDANESPGFYEDQSVFRPGKIQRSETD